jgi:hypothetical protein
MVDMSSPCSSFSDPVFLAFFLLFNLYGVLQAVVLVAKFAVFVFEQLVIQAEELPPLFDHARRLWHRLKAAAKGGRPRQKGS